ncbi:MAG: DNA methylase [Verrucomicrobia bacterium ADurb.Bin018]|nr:MAG: DNA methylase [Verrucomicrobia bacterium ADurb.Bin018]
MDNIDHIGQLKPDPRNARKHNPRNVGMIEKALGEVGAARSIVIDEEGVVLAGNGVLEAAGNAGIERVQVVDADGETIVAVRRKGLTPEQKAKLALYDNRTAELAEWDTEVLADIGKDIDLGEMWTADELRDIGVAQDEPTEDPGPQIDRAEELQEKWQVKRGDVWEIGKHRLMCGDSTSAEDVGRLMAGQKAGAVVTDPPYGINREGIANDDPEGLRALFDGCLAVMPIDNAVVIAFQSPRLFPVWLDAARQAGHRFERALWMHKLNGATTFPWRGWLMVGEILIVSSFGSPQWHKPREYSHDCYVVELGKQKDVQGLHSTPKPPEVVRNILDNTIGTIYEPFLGSGTTLVAAEQTGRICYGMEIEPKYCAVTLERLAGMGLEPLRILTNG